MNRRLCPKVAIIQSLVYIFWVGYKTRTGPDQDAATPPP